MDSSGTDAVASCVNHPAAPVAGQCGRCGASFCRFCLVTLGDQKFCTRCKGTQKIPAKAPVVPTGNTGMMPRRTTQMMPRKADDFSPFGPPQKPPDSKGPVVPPPPAAKPRFVPASERAVVPAAFVEPTAEIPAEPEPEPTGQTAPAYPKGTLRMLRERRPTAGPGTIPSPAASSTKSTVTAGTIACKNHISASATRACNRCSAFYCPNCVKKLHEMELCPSCSDPLRELTRQELNLPVITFQEQLPGCFQYPFQGDGWLILILGTLGYWICDLMVAYSINPILSWLIWVGATGYLTSYAMRVIRTSAIGQKVPPGWPSFANFWDSMLIPYWRFTVPALLAMGLPLVVLFAAGPSSTIDDDEDQTPALTGMGQLTEQDIKNGLPEFQQVLLKKPKVPHEPESHALFWTLWLAFVAVCLILLPMALLGVTLFNSFDALSPGFLINSVLKIPAEYLFCYLALIASIAMKLFGSYLLLGWIPLFGSIPTLFIAFYIFIVQSRMLGLLYFEKQDHLNWFAKVVTIEEQRKLEEKKDAEKAGFTF